MNGSLPAISKLAAYIAAHDGSANAFALRAGLHQSELSKLLRGIRTRVSVVTAWRIQKATKGAVGWQDWIPPRILRA